jgi:pimeloyl-ACP methyl ester carboxylesterase
LVVEPTQLVISASEKIDYELGTLYVPENRGNPNSRIIGLGFVRIKAAAPTNSPPTFHLPGGPGNSYLMVLKNVIPNMLTYRKAGDVVLVDQRGFSTRGDILKYSYGKPEEPLDQPASLAAATAAYVKLAREAVASFEGKNIDLRGYTVKECAEDVNDLRKALGYDKISLVGVSFGSQWSFAIMRLHPEIVARALLSGVEPLDYGYDSPSGVCGAMQRYWKEAQQDKALQSYVPEGGLEAAAREVLKRLESSPVKAAVKDPQGGQAVTVTLGKEDFQRDFVRAAPDGPAFLLSLYHGHYDAWATTVLAKRRARQAAMTLLGPLVDTSLGVTPKRLAQLKADPASGLLGQWNWDGYVASAEIWPTADVGDDFRTAVQTPIPVIFAQGDWDTQTPVENTLEIIKSFPNGRVIIAERGGHGVLDPIARRFPKVWDQILDFLRAGDMPDLPDRVTLPLPKFTVPNFPPPGSTVRP